MQQAHALFLVHAFCKADTISWWSLFHRCVVRCCSLVHMLDTLWNHSRAGGTWPTPPMECGIALMYSASSSDKLNQVGGSSIHANRTNKTYYTPFAGVAFVTAATYATAKRRARNAVTEGIMIACVVQILVLAHVLTSCLFS